MSYSQSSRANYMINFTNALEMLKLVRSFASRSADAALKQSMLDLQGCLLNLQVQMLEQQIENRELQSEVGRLRERLATGTQLLRTEVDAGEGAG